jgi:hypothetical protein
MSIKEVKFSVQMAFHFQQRPLLQTYAFDSHCYNVCLICKQRVNMHLTVNLVSCL